MAGCPWIYGKGLLAEIAREAFHRFLVSNGCEASMTTPVCTNNPKRLEGYFYRWPRGSTGVERYGCIPRSGANNLGEIPQKMGAPNPLFKEFFFWGGNTLGLVPSSRPHSLGYACTLYAPTSPLVISITFFVFGTLSVTFFVAFLMLLSLFSSPFLPNSSCRTPFAAG